MADPSKPIQAKPKEAPPTASTSKGFKEEERESADIPFHLPKRMSCLDLTKGCGSEVRKSADSNQDASENDESNEVHMKSYAFLEGREVVTSLGDLSLDEKNDTTSTVSNTSYEPPIL